MLTADTITHTQIRELYLSFLVRWERGVDTESDRMWARECSIALGETVTVNDPQGDRARARARCAEAINARSSK